MTTDFTTLAEDLASHGFIVAGFDVPYRSFVVVLPDGRVAVRDNRANVENANSNLDDPLVGRLLAMWVTDTAFVTEQLQRLNADSTAIFNGRIDMTRLGAFGHSFGGATALEFCRIDARCKAAVDIDGIPFGGVVSQGLGKPGMFLLSDHSREPATERSRVLAEIQSIYDDVPGPRMYAVLKHANHFSFSDQILTNSQVAYALMRLMGVGGMDGRRGLAITSDYVHTYFDVSLNGSPVTDLNRLRDRYPEVQIQGPSWLVRELPRGFRRSLVLSD